MTRLTQEERDHFYFFGGVTHPQHENDPLKPQRKILLDLWMELAERGDVLPFINAANSYVSGIEKRGMAVSIIGEETLGKAIKSLRRKLQKPKFRRRS